MVLTIHIQCDNCRARLQPAGASVWALAEFSLTLGCHLNRGPLTQLLNDEPTHMAPSKCLLSPQEKTPMVSKTACSAPA